MKPVFTCLAFIISLSAMAGFDDTRLTISSGNGVAIRVMVDGNRYSRNNGAVVIRNLPAGYHMVKVFQKRPGRAGTGFGRSYQQVYSAQLYIKQQFHTDITINRFGKPLVDEQMMGPGYADEDDEDEDWVNNGNGGWNNGGNGNGGGWNNGNNGGGGWNNAGNVQTMDVRLFEQFKQTLRNEMMENSRLVVAKQTIAVNAFTSAQVKEIVNLFSFESNKLEMAKYMYKYTVDKGSYFILNDAFSFSSSKEDLANYIRNYR